MRTIRTLLEGHIETLRAEFAPKLRGLDFRVQDVFSRLHGVEEDRQRHHRHPRVHYKQSDTFRLAKLEEEMSRVSLELEGKADNSEVEAALRERVSKTSLAKRIKTLLDDDAESAVKKVSTLPTNTLQRLKARMEILERQNADQDEIMSRVFGEVEAIKAHVLGSKGAENGRDEDSISAIMKSLQAMLQQQSRRLSRAEREMGSLRESAMQDMAALTTQLEERGDPVFREQEELRQRQEQTAAVLKALEEKTEASMSAVRALQAQMLVVGRGLGGEGKGRGDDSHTEETARAVATLEAKIHAQSQETQVRLDKVESAVAFQAGQRGHILHRLDRLDRCQWGLAAGAFPAPNPPSLSSYAASLALSPQPRASNFPQASPKPPLPRREQEPVGQEAPPPPASAPSPPPTQAGREVHDMLTEAPVLAGMGGSGGGMGGRGRWASAGWQRAQSGYGAKEPCAASLAAPFPRPHVNVSGSHGPPPPFYEAPPPPLYSPSAAPLQPSRQRVSHVPAPHPLSPDQVRFRPHPPVHPAYEQPADAQEIYGPGGQSRRQATPRTEECPGTGGSHDHVEGSRQAAGMPPPSDRASHDGMGGAEIVGRTVATAGGEGGQGELEALRREKFLLRTRITEGIMSQSTCRDGILNVELA
ncbi:hypothetical protein NSK_001954 [Nannochloropsis salina CCMP1776]|uniref:Uncharacterized protein n=1 Tax=Nannochloropsis salina CCMP1776 TaxID=1027361 RepID=A0A4D9D658_9STRA|nr:hypothetical protein NSK_001954 [Nannochloropsis salina CCMP1776]|eukprot:TFJ86866.1 hypothetical protein NSK_001954 [Nannochloropsis salina CCMP1776]